MSASTAIEETVFCNFDLACFPVLSTPPPPPPPPPPLRAWGKKAAKSKIKTGNNISSFIVYR